MTKRYYIGYDCGTMGTKVAIYTIDGQLVADAYREHEILYPKPGWAEMEAEQFYRVVADGIKECVTKGKVDPDEVGGISCSGIICGIVPIDADWRPIGPYIPYLDGRAQKEVQGTGRDGPSLGRGKRECGTGCLYAPHRPQMDARQ